MEAEPSAEAVTPPPEDRSGVRIFPPLIFAAGLAAGFVLQWLYPVTIVAEAFEPPLRVVGVACILAWLLLAIWAILTLRRIGTSPNPAGPTTSLAFVGPYRFTRNPMYLGLALLTIGLALVTNALWPLVLLPLVLFVLVRAVIAQEERYLAGKFGEPYREYMVRVRRWL